MASGKSQFIFSFVFEHLRTGENKIPSEPTEGSLLTQERHFGFRFFKNS